MLHRFRKTRDAPPSDILAGETRSNVEAFGEVDITVDEPNDRPWKITLRDVYYIPNFMTNIVAQRKFRAKGVYFDDQHMKLHAKEKTLKLMKHIYGHDILKHASHEIIQSSTPEGVKVHTSYEIIQQSTPEGMKMKGMKNKKMKKTKQIISKKQTYSRAPKRAENEKNKTDHRAISTSQEKSSNSIKFGIFNFISSH